ncbi:MAG TPA: hypothetical protein VFS43_01315 [Polyangiaceae bacterium]|nr:hypothetical protein [Polyangiaceae bacterium]
MSASGWDSATQSSYGGSGRGTYQGSQLDATLIWTNGATPTWVKLRPPSDGRTMTGRRGKFGKENAKYEGDCNGSRS